MLDLFEGIAGFFELLFAGPAVWLTVIGLTVVGLTGYAVYDTYFKGPETPQEIHEQAHQECVDSAYFTRDKCMNGGIFKTKGRVKACEEIFEKDLARCP